MDAVPGLGAWLLGHAGSHHLGASGVTHGLGFLLFVLGLLRRDRAAIAAGMLAFLFYGGMLMTILPREAGVSWESHLGGARGRRHRRVPVPLRADPQPPKPKYSWEIEEELARQQGDAERAMYEPKRQRDVPVLWHRRPPSGVVLPSGRGPRP